MNIRETNNQLNTTYKSKVSLIPGAEPGLMSENELLDNIENQFNDFSDYSYREDFIRAYIIHFLKYPLGESDMSKLEENIDWTENNIFADSYCMVKRTISRFFYLYGISLEDADNVNECDFELLHILYRTFILDLPKTCAMYLLGLKNPKNEYFGNYKEFDPNNIENNTIIEQAATEELIFTEDDINKYTKSIENLVKSKKVVFSPNNSIVFNKIMLKTIFDETFSLDGFFKILLLADENNYDYEFLDDMIDRNLINIEHDIFVKNIRTAMYYPDNLELTENYYHSIENKRKSIQTNLI